MLILTRRIGETLMIGDDVTATILGVQGNQIRIGINAPKHIAVHREEIYAKIQRELVSEVLAQEHPVDQKIDTSSASQRSKTFTNGIRNFTSKFL